jgi:hypothetical protein
MSFLRHKQIYRPMDRSGQAGAVATPPRSHRPMSLRPAIPRRVALLHCSPPLHQPTAMVMPVAGQRQPPLSRGWRLFDGEMGKFHLALTVMLTTFPDQLIGLSAEGVLCYLVEACLLQPSPHVRVRPFGVRISFSYSLTTCDGTNWHARVTRSLLLRTLTAWLAKVRLFKCIPEYAALLAF